jgi:hypothetical protein
MNDTVNAFKNLPDEATKQLTNLNSRIQKHSGPWGESRGGDTDENGVMQMPWWEQNPLIGEFVKFMYDNNLIVNFDWGSWDKGREWYKSTDETKYDRLDVETALKLITAVVRNDRFHDGTLVNAFESGAFPKIINRLAEMK